MLEVKFSIFVLDVLYNLIIWLCFGKEGLVYSYSCYSSVSFGFEIDIDIEDNFV